MEQDTHDQAIPHAGSWRRLLAALVDAALLGCVAALVLPFASHLLDVVCNRGDFGLSSMNWGYGFAAGMLMFIDSLVVAIWPTHLIYQIAGCATPALRSVTEWYTPGNVMASVLAVLLNWFYHARLESSRWQTTIGKHCLKLKVTGSDGQQLSLGRATARHFLKALITFPVTLLFQFISISTAAGLPFWGAAVVAGFAPMLFTKKKQALHDLLVQTLVVKTTGTT